MTKVHHWVIAGLSLLALGSCTEKDSSLPGKQKPKQPQGNGTLSLHVRLSPETSSYSRATPYGTTPSVADFTLDITQEEAVVKRLSPIGESPGDIELPTGTYQLSCYSATFIKPQFEFPVFGGSGSVEIRADERSRAEIVCAQINSGISITYSTEFMAHHTTYSTRITQGNHSLEYTGENASKTGYFAPGNVTITVTADGKTHTQEVTLQPRAVYHVSIDDEIQVIPGGEFELALSISTTVTEERVEIAFPTENQSGGEAGTSLAFRENMGASPVNNTPTATPEHEWQNREATYTFDGVCLTSAGASSGYTDASGGNSLMFRAEESFEVSGINTSGCSNLTLKFGCYSGSRPFNTEEFDVEVSDNGVSYTPLTYTREANTYWEEVSISSGIPLCNNLRVRFSCQTGRYQLDDIQIKGTR